MKHYDAIFFDWDGVITDSVDIKTQAFSDMFAQFGKEIQSKVVLHHTLNGGMSRFEKFALYYKEYLGVILDEQKMHALTNEFSLLVKEKIVQAQYIEGAYETILSQYEKGVQLFVVSGTPTQELVEIVKSKKLERYFLELCGSPTSKKEWLSMLLQKYSLKEDACLIVGDSLVDYEAAIATGVNFLGIVHELHAHIFPQGTNVSKRVYI